MPKKHESFAIESYELRVGPDGEDGNPHSVNIDFSYGVTTFNLNERHLETISLALPRKAAQDFATALLAFLAKTWREEEAEEPAPTPGR
jgi:hypothetical protein